MKSIKTKLILLIVGALFIVSATFGIVSYTMAKKMLLKETERNFIQITTEISRVVQANMEKNISIVESLGERRIVDDNTPWAEKVSDLKNEAERTGFQMFALADLSGRAVFYNAQRTTHNISERPYFKRAVSGISTYSDVVMNMETGLLTVTVAVPLKRNNRIVGVLFGMREGNEITNLIKDIKLGETGYAYILNNKGANQGHRNTKLVDEQYNPIEAAKNDSNVRELAEVVKIAISGKSGVAQYLF